MYIVVYQIHQRYCTNYIAFDAFGMRKIISLFQNIRGQFNLIYLVLFSKLMLYATN